MLKITNGHLEKGREHKTLLPFSKNTVDTILPRKNVIEEQLSLDML